LFSRALNWRVLYPEYEIDFISYYRISINYSEPCIAK
jgi:hypothetical protein